MDVFLAAGVPSRERGLRYFESADILLIREAIKALIEVVLPRGRLVFGGHPAITPLIALSVQQLGLEPSRLTVFQSAAFQTEFPEALSEFYDVRVIAADGDRDLSLGTMRVEMLSSRSFHAGVFIGGMDGVMDEARLFREMHPAAKFLPVASAGGAADVLYREETGLPVSLARELTYRTLFRRLL